MLKWSLGDTRVFKHNTASWCSWWPQSWITENSGKSCWNEVESRFFKWLVIEMKDIARTNDGCESFLDQWHYIWLPSLDSRKHHKHIVTERLLGIDHGAHDRNDPLDPDKYTSSTRNKVLKSFSDLCSFHFHVDESWLEECTDIIRHTVFQLDPMARRNIMDANRIRKGDTMLWPASND